MPRCPECDERVSSSQAECPNCGAAIRPGKKKSGGGSQTTTILIVLVCVLGFCLVGGGGVFIALLLPAVQQARNAARFSQSSNNMKQIGLGMFNYSDMNRVLAASGTFTEDGQPHHGWGTRMLPYVDQAPLYNQIDFNKPWTAPEMSGAFRTPVIVYVYPGSTDMVTSDGFAAAHYSMNSQLFPKNEFIKFMDIKDGSSNTIMGGEAGGSFKAWGSPENVRDPAKGIGTGADQFGAPTGGNRIGLLLSDGSVRRIAPDIDQSILNALATPSGGEVIPEF